MGSMTSTWAERKRIGDQLEQRVTAELLRRGWSVSPSGQGCFTDQICAALHLSDSPVRWIPDLIASHGPTVCWIDCKASLSGGRSRRHAVEQRAVKVHLQLFALLELPIFYVFDELGVLTPFDVMLHGSEGPATAAGSGAAYYLVPAAGDRAFDTVFGSPSPPARQIAA